MSSLATPPTSLSFYPSRLAVVDDRLPGVFQSRHQLFQPLLRLKAVPSTIQAFPSLRQRPKHLGQLDDPDLDAAEANL